MHTALWKWVNQNSHFRCFILSVQSIQPKRHLQAQNNRHGTSNFFLTISWGWNWKKMGYQWKLRTEFQTGKKLSLWIVKLGSVLPKNRKFGAKHLECRADFLAHVNGVLFSTLFIFFSKTLGNLFIKRHAENLKFTVCKLRYLGLLTSNVFRRNHILKLTLFQIS